MPRMDWHQLLGLPNPGDFSILTKELFGEFLGTLWIVFFGCGSVLAPGLPSNDVVQISLAFGLAVFIGVHLTSSLSGGNLNPAVTFGLFLTGRIGLFKLVFYVIAQCLGGIAGAAILYGVTPTKILQGPRTLAINKVFTVLNDSCNTTTMDFSDIANETTTNSCIDLTASVTESQGLIIEIITTFALVLIVLNLTDPGAEQYWSPPLIVGLTVSLCHVLAIPYTGCSVNPARSLGPSVVSGLFPNHWIFWIGPLVGSLLAALVHIFVFRINIEKRYEVSSKEKIEIQQMESM